MCSSARNFQLSPTGTSDAGTAGEKRSGHETVEQPQTTTQPAVGQGQFTDLQRAVGQSVRHPLSYTSAR